MRIKKHLSFSILQDILVSFGAEGADMHMKS